MSDYWSSTLAKRLSRRRMLAATGATAAGAAFLAACGGSDDSGKPTTSSIFTAPADSTKEAKAGGVWISGSEDEPVSLDPQLNTSTGAITRFQKHIYSHLLKQDMGMDVKSASTIIGDAATSWEISPDGKQVTLKLRPNLKFDPRPPTNGKTMTSADVKNSWDRLIASNPVATDVLYSKNPAGPVESMNAPDASTVVFKLAYPYAPIIDLLAHQQILMISPTEINDAGFNWKIDARGSGPWMIDKWETNVRFDMKKNPNYYDASKVYLDEWKRTVIPEYATARAQFETGALWDMFLPRQDDLLIMKRDHPTMVLSQNPNFNGLTGLAVRRIDFSQRPESMFADVRVRRAASMLMDRDAYADVFYNLQSFRDAGLPTEIYWNSHAGAGGPAWLNPKDEKAFGEGAQYFKYNPEESKKLLSAAGHLNTAWDFNMTPRNSPRELEIMSGMIRNGMPGMNYKQLDYNTEYQALQGTWNDGHLGTFAITCSGYNEDHVLAKSYTPNGNDRLTSRPIPVVTDLVLKSRSELDTNKRIEMFKDIQREIAKNMYAIVFPTPPEAKLYTLAWPWLRNYKTLYRGTTSREETTFWYDASKRPA